MVEIQVGKKNEAMHLQLAQAKSLRVTEKNILDLLVTIVTTLQSYKKQNITEHQVNENGK